jgi:hypothetical protein
MILTAGELIINSLEAYLLPLEEQLFGEFLKDLAIFIAGSTYGGRPSSAPGIDLEYISREMLFLIAIKPGVNWGNDLQWVKLEAELQNAQILYEETFPSLRVQSVLGICYGRPPTTHVNNRGCLIVTGQNFWYFISENKGLYTDLIELVGYRAREHNSLFAEERDKAINRLLRDFGQTFQKPNGEIDLVNLLELHCGNFDSIPLPAMTN